VIVRMEYVTSWDEALEVLARGAALGR
jgi:hypothetical protein